MKSPTPADLPLRARNLDAELSASPDGVAVTVRELLSWFNAKRRGYLVVALIRQYLDDAGLESEPDFESVHIDAEVRLRRLLGQGHPAPDAGVEGTHLPSKDVVEGVAAAIVDPTFRLRRLPSATAGVYAVPPTASIAQATTLMLAKGFSQLPVMPNPRDVKGVISWRSLGKARALGKKPERVSDCMEVARELPDSEAVFTALATIVEHDYVLVRAADRTITGIVTSSDLSVQFRQLAEPFLLIGEIENHLRYLLDLVVDPAALAAIAVPDGGQAPKAVRELTFSQYVQLFNQDAVWARLAVALDRQVFCRELNQVRAIRNDVMHFNPDPFDESDLQSLRSFAELVRHLSDALNRGR